MKDESERGLTRREVLGGRPGGRRRPLGSAGFLLRRRRGGGRGEGGRLCGSGIC